MTKRFARCLLLTAFAVMFLMANCITAAAAETYTLPITVKYGQTDARSILAMMNNFRQSKDAWYWNSDNKTKTELTGLKPMTYDYGLEQIAMQRAAEIAVSFSHTRPNGTSCFTATSSNGKTASAENIAAGYSTASSAFIGWREDDDPYAGQGHRRAMLGNYTHVGIAHVYVNGTHYWVQEFGSATGVAQTAANDSSKSVNIAVASNMITDLSVTASASSMTVQLGKTAAVPTAKVTFSMVDTWIQWGGTDPASTLTPNWSVSGSAVTVSGGTMTAKAIGTSTLTATVCGKKLTVNVKVECTDHKWSGWTVSKAATCTEQGSQTRKCSLCGKSETQAIAAKGHSFGAYKVTKAATCTDAGTETRTCSACSKTESRSIAATGHSFGAYKVTKAATCTDAGTETRTCASCSKTESRSIAAMGHKWGAYKVVKKPTTEAEGTEERTCSECKATEQRAVAKLTPAATTTTTTKPADEPAPPATTTTPEVTDSQDGNSKPADSKPDGQTPDDSKPDAPADSEPAEDSSAADSSDADSSASDPVAPDESAPDRADGVSSDSTESVPDSAGDTSASDLTAEADSSSQDASTADAPQTDDSEGFPMLYVIIGGAGAALVIGLVIFFALRRKKK